MQQIASAVGSRWSPWGYYHADLGAAAVDPPPLPPPPSGTREAALDLVDIVADCRFIFESV